METVFVPFVQGRLLAAVHAVKFRGNIEGPRAERAQRGFGAVLSPESFAYSDSFDLNVPYAATTNNLDDKAGMRGFALQKGLEESPVMARMVLPVDTLRLAYGDNGVGTLRLQLLDLDTVGEGGKQYCLGQGDVQTASLYYQAMRSAASAGLAGTSSGSGDSVGASPWMPDVVDITDNTLNRVTATVVISTDLYSGAPDALRSRWQCHSG